MFYISMTPTVAVVINGHDRIGFVIVRGLCKRYDGIVYLTSPDMNRGRNAVAELNKEGLHPKYHQLDISDPKSIEVFRDYIKGNYGGLDILVNNAADTPKCDPMESLSSQAEKLFFSYFSIVSTCDLLFPLLKKGARVVNVLNAVRHFGNIPSEKLRSRFVDPTLTINELSDLMRQYVDAAKQGTHATDWGNSSYVVCKVGLTALTMVQQRLLHDRDIKVNAIQPTREDVDINFNKGFHSVDEVAVATVFSALDTTYTFKGQYVWCD